MFDYSDENSGSNQYVNYEFYDRQRPMSVQPYGPGPGPMPKQKFQYPGYNFGYGKCFPYCPHNYPYFYGYGMSPLALMLALGAFPKEDIF